jgi:hypothetical protein
MFGLLSSVDCRIRSGARPMLTGVTPKRPLRRDVLREEVGTWIVAERIVVVGHPAFDAVLRVPSGRSKPAFAASVPPERT